MYTLVDMLQCRGRAALRVKAEKGRCYWEGAIPKSYYQIFNFTFWVRSPGQPGLAENLSIFLAKSGYEAAQDPGGIFSMSHGDPG